MRLESVVGLAPYRGVAKHGDITDGRGDACVAPTGSFRAGLGLSFCGAGSWPLAPRGDAVRVKCRCVAGPSRRTRCRAGARSALPRVSDASSIAPAPCSLRKMKVASRSFASCMSVGVLHVTSEGQEFTRRARDSGREMRSSGIHTARESRWRRGVPAPAHPRIHPARASRCSSTRSGSPGGIACPMRARSRCADRGSSTLPAAAGRSRARRILRSAPKRSR